jgi:hypothetical protein
MPLGSNRLPLQWSMPYGGNLAFDLDGLLDEPRVGAPRKITDQQLKKS